MLQKPGGPTGVFRVQVVKEDSSVSEEDCCGGRGYFSAVPSFFPTAITYLFIIIVL